VLRVTVRPVSLLHSSAVNPQALEGTAAELLEPALLDFFQHASSAAMSVVLLPLFFGPSAALSEYVPSRLEALKKRFPEARICLAKPLVEIAESDERIAGALADATRQVITRKGLVRPQVVLVDHGSPVRGVTEVRNHLGTQLRHLMEDDVEGVAVASMERRPGEEFAFNAPLLADCLRSLPTDCGDVVVTLQFLSPGRHAGGAGDIAEICAEAEKDRPNLRTHRSEPIGLDSRVVAVLADRYREACQSSFLGSIKPTSKA
jgi:sirohydrochlorin ferrochelatase